jgi:hypothetical protein
MIVHALYADDFLHFTDNPRLYQMFKDQFRTRFEIKTGSVSMYLGNRVTVDQSRQNVVLDQTEFVSELLERFGMKDSTPVSMVARLSSVNAGEILQATDHEFYRAIVGSLLYLACWSRLDISLAVSEPSRFVSLPCQCHALLVAAKHLLRYLKGTKELGMVYSKPGNHGPMDTANLLWGYVTYVDSDWAGCPDSRRSTSGPDDRGMCSCLMEQQWRGGPRDSLLLPCPLQRLNL